MELLEEKLVGQVDSIFFENPTNFYKVLRVTVDEQQSSFIAGHEMVCTGQFATLHLDTTYEFFGKVTQHPKYGEQFSVSRYQQVAPTSAQGMIDYLASDRFKGIGKTLATRIIETLGETALERIVDDVDALKQVKGLTPAKRRELRLTLLQHQGTERVFMQLNEWGFGPKLAERIYTVYKSTAIDAIRANPYELIEKIDGIGFTKADLLAEQLGFEALSIERLVAGVIVAIQEWCMTNGDTYVQKEHALTIARQLLEKSRPHLIEQAELELALDKAILDKKIQPLLDGLMLPSLYFAEVGIANRVAQFLQYEHVERFSEEEIATKIDEVVQITGIPYDEQQRSALKLAVQSPMSIITGGPGTGKTTLIKGLLVLHALLHDYDLAKIQQKIADESPILLAAPTGRAAKRMTEMTGLPAATIHRLIGYTRESSVEDFHANELEGNLLIVDEMSMVDTWLMNWLIQAIPYHMQVIFVGDKDQLPSVGPGKVFSDLITSHTIPTISLTKIYRQSQESSIVELAHTIRQGYLPQNLLEKQADRSFIPCQTGQVAQVIQQIVQSALNKGYNATNLQVLAPMYKGAAGIHLLNERLQALFNPPTPKKREIPHFEQIFRVGDKVLQLINNADEGVYNGDIGQISGIFWKNETESGVDEVVVTFDEKELTYKRGDLEQLTLAYCCSIHKSQGSEYPLVILPLVDTYSRMLRKDLVYTAVTRAKQSLVLLGNPNSFIKAVSQQEVPRRTFLEDLLKVKLSKESEQIFEETSDYKTETELNIEPLVLSEETLLLIDPMIGMDNLTPYDFID